MICRSFNSFFVGQPELERKLDLAKLSQFRQEAGTRCRIKALSWKESKKYIDHRFKLAGSSISEVYTPMALTMIIGYAGGFPRVIDTLCDNALIRGYQCFKKRIGVSIICEVISQMESQVPTKPIRARIIRVIGNVVQRYSL